MRIILELITRWLVKHFAPRPVLLRRGKRLLIRSGWRTNILTLGGRSRKVYVDAFQKTVRVQDRTFCVIFRSRIVPFDQILQVVYTYNDLMGWSRYSSPLDLFEVGLLLTNGKIIKLFRYFGEGDFANHTIISDPYFWDEIISSALVKHNLDYESRNLAETLAFVIGVRRGDRVI